MKNLPKSIQIVPKWVKNFDQNLIILKLIAKVVEFRQIWSHWLKDNFVSTMPSTKQNIGCVCCSNETK